MRRPERPSARGLALALALALLGTACVPAPASPAAPRAAAADPAPPAALRSTKIGVHTRLTDEVEPEKIERTFALLRAMGGTWAVEYFPWAYGEPRPGEYRWEHSDLVVAAAARHGIRLLARIDLVPEWARPPDSSPRLLLPERYGEYAAFVAAFARRYHDRLAGLIVWNEPNVSFEWGFRPVSAAEYARLLEAAYRAVKAVTPELPVLAAGLAPTLERSAWGRDDLVYLAELYDAGAGPFFDALAAHAYGWQLPPDDPPASERINFRRIELLRALMVARGDGAKPVYLTEGGWNDHPRWTKAVRPAQRTAYTVRAYEIATNEWPWLPALCLWAFRFPRPTRNYNDYFTFLNPDFSPKPVYLAVQAWAEGRSW